jgi:general secretion pathway protein G
MIVISLLLILMAIAVPIYQQSILRAKESVLKQDLFTMRQVIDQYTLDKQKAPQSLEDVVSAGYMRKLPPDPFTGRSDTWVPVQDDTVEDPAQTEPGISDVHSGSNQVGSDGRPYSEW